MAPPRRPCPPPELTDDLVSEILLRVPPEEPAHLVRASLVCKSWLRLLSERTFLRQYREFHRTPPLLGFLYNRFFDPKADEDTVAFVPTTTARFLVPVGARQYQRWALDCRHGRVLIQTLNPMGHIVWEPITGDQKQVPMPVYPNTYCTGAVLCAVAGCDHLYCCGGWFLVVLVGSHDADGGSWVSVYSSETGVWSPSTKADLSVSANTNPNTYVAIRPSNLTGDALYFILERGKSILKYDLGERSLSMVDPPLVYQRSSIVMTAEDGALGFAGIGDTSLYLWSLKDGDEDIAGWTLRKAGWTLRRVIELDRLIPMRNMSVFPYVIGFVEGTCTVFISTDDGVFTLDFKSRKVRKVSKQRGLITVLPYTSFYAPLNAMG